MDKTTDEGPFFPERDYRPIIGLSKGGHSRTTTHIGRLQTLSPNKGPCC